MSTLSLALTEKYQTLNIQIGEMESVLVAFSGGVDSSLVAFVAHKLLGEKMLAVTSASPSLKREDYALTEELAASWQMPHRVIFTEELENPTYLANSPNRCYTCKSTLYTAMLGIQKELGFANIINGTNSDDLGDFRPGLQAARESSVRSPLVDNGFSKQDVRELSRFLGLINADKPQSACLSSRVPHGMEISVKLLAQIERAEMVLSRMGFTQFRVRHHDTVARLELLPEEIPRALSQRLELEKRLKSCGYRFVAVDLAGFRSGSLNP